MTDSRIKNHKALKDYLKVNCILLICKQYVNIFDVMSVWDTEKCVEKNSTHNDTFNTMTIIYKI